MAISLDTFRNLAETGNIALGQDGASLREATFGDKFKLFFGFGSARADNAAILNDFKNALRSDSRYFAVHDKIESLVGEIRTDRAIGATQIKSVLTQLDRASTRGKQAEAFRERVLLHLAARGTPEELKGLSPKLYVSHLVDYMHDNTGTPYGEINISTGIEAFNQQMLGHLASIGGDADLKEVFFTSNLELMRTADAKIRSPEGVEARLAGMRATLEEARACVGTYGDGLMKDVKAFLSCGKGFPAGTLAKALGDASMMLGNLLKGVDFSDAKTVPSKVHAAMRDFARYLKADCIRIGNDDKDIQNNASVLLANAALRALDAETRTNLARFLTSDEGVQLRQLQHLPRTEPLVQLKHHMAIFAATAVELAGLPEVADDLFEPPANPRALGLSRGDLFDLTPGTLSPEEVRTEKSLRAHEPFLREHPVYGASPENMDFGADVLSAMDETFGPSLVPAEGERPKAGQIERSHVDFVRGVLLTELAEMPAEKRPASKDLLAFIANNPLVLFAKSTVDGKAGPLRFTATALRLRQMNGAQRAACLAVINAFGTETSSSELLMFRFGEHVAELTALHDAGKLTWENAYETMTGRPVPQDKVASGATPAGIWQDYEQRAITFADELLEKGEISDFQHRMILVLTTDEGLTPEVALQVARGEIQKPAAGDPFKPLVTPQMGAGIADSEKELAGDLHRIGGDYVVDGRPSGVPQGGTFVFKHSDDAKMPESTVSTSKWAATADPKDLKRFRVGNRSSLSEDLRTKTLQLCKGHEEQARLVMSALGQASMIPVRNLAQLHGVTANEHSPAVWTLERRDNGDVAVTVSQPEKCPLEFKSTLVFSADGRQRMEGEPTMRRAD